MQLFFAIFQIPAGVASFQLKKNFLLVIFIQYTKHFIIMNSYDIKPLKFKIFLVIGEENMVKLLVENGADINAINGLNNTGK